MRKKVKNNYNVRVTVGDLPFEYDPNNKGAMEKLAHANKIGLDKVIREDEEDNNSRSKATLPSQKTKRGSRSQSIQSSTVGKAKRLG
jgi:hypothetical protein